MQSERANPLYGLAARFDSPEAVIEAARKIYGAGYRRTEAYTPYPVTGLADALGVGRTGVPLLVFTAVGISRSKCEI